MSFGELCVTPLGAAASAILYTCAKKTRTLKSLLNQNVFTQITERFLSQCYIQEMNRWPTSATALGTFRTTLQQASQQYRPPHTSATFDHLLVMHSTAITKRRETV
jgi:hypothetical protein